MFGIVNGYENFTSYKDNSKTWLVCINKTYEWRLRGLDVRKALCVKLYVDYKVKLIVNWLYQCFFFKFSLNVKNNKWSPETIIYVLIIY